MYALRGNLFTTFLGHRTTEEQQYVQKRTYLRADRTEEIEIRSSSSRCPEH